MANPLNVAAPLPTVVAVAFVSVAPAGPVAITAVTGTPAPPAGLPAPSRTWSTGCCPKAAPLVAVAEGSVVRSEEGRVGEEGRSRWAPDPLKKKTANRDGYMPRA